MMTSTILTKKIKQLGRLCANPAIVFWSLPWLMILLVLGTVIQKDIGLYEATQLYFNSIIYWIGPVPTPGGLTTIAVITFTLTIKFFFFSQWSWIKSGIILTHLGILFLLIGGLITMLTTNEGFMAIPEGETTADIIHFYDKELIVRQNGDILHSYDFNQLEEKKSLTISGLKIHILMKCENCGAQAPSGQYESLKDLAQNMELTKIKSLTEKEANFSGLILGIESNDKPNQDGTYIVMEDIQRAPSITKENGENITLELSRKKTRLPFSISLKDFRKIDYNGTNKAKNFQSDIIIQEGLLSWPATIEMNQPYRYRGYTFFQSSFDILPDQEITVLNVVENKGRLFPYISTAIIMLGLLMHLAINIRRAAP